MSSQHEITTLIRSFCELTNVGICFYDNEQFFHYNRTGEREYTGHYCDFCRFARSLPGGRVACEKSDHGEAERLARVYKKPFFHRCHMGLCELVLPVVRCERLLGLVFIGQCRIEGEDASAEVIKGAQARGGDVRHFLELYQALPAIKREQLLAMGDLFDLYFSQIGGDRSIFDGEGTAAGKEGKSLAERIAAYVDANYYRNLTSGILSERFFVNPSYMARAFQKRYGESVTSYIHRVRIRNACRLLRDSNISVNSIALNVGYDDSNYFCRLFRRLQGMSPIQYRRQQRIENEQTSH